MALTLNKKSNVGQKSMSHPTMLESKEASDLDFDMLVTHVENTISKDRQRHHVGFTPQELMLRSNPGLFSWDNIAPGDLTNPREIYNALSNKTKSIEDLEAKFKKELVNSVQKSGSFPKLSRTLSMSDLDHKHGKSYKAFDNSHRQLNTLVLKRHNTSVLEGLQKVREMEAENERAVNLPHIESQTNNKGIIQKAKETNKTDKELPNIVQTNDNIHKNVDTQQTNIGDMKQNTNNKQHVSFSDTKLEKWFSEMPSEMFDRAQRALMEESIQERLQEFKRKRSRKANFPSPSFNICIGSKHRRVPNTYLELRVDSFGRHLQAEKDDRRNRYRLHQKSMHNLKMRENTDADLHERLHRENTFPRLTANKARPPATPAKSKTKADQDVPTQTSRKNLAKVSEEGGFKTLYINDKFNKEIGASFTQRHGITNYEDYTDRLMAMKETQYHEFLRTILHSPPNSQHDPDEVHMSSIAFERENTKATVVNLQLKKETPKSRTPFHIEKSLLEASKSNAIETKSYEITQSALEQQEENEEMEETTQQDKIITKIPTAQSTRTSESRSSTSSFMSKTNKEAMKRFNKLEVFAEGHQPVGGMTQLHHNTEGFRPVGQASGTAFPVSSKADVKHLHGKLHHEMEAGHVLKEIRRPEQELVFRFEPGEVFISRKNPNKTLTHTVSSDRARVIYGKVVNSGRGKKHHISKQVNRKEMNRDTNSTVTKSTKLDFYRSEVGKYESRAIEDGMTNISTRHENETDPMLIVTSTGLQGVTHTQRNNLNKSNEVVTKRDVATETEIIGSPNALQLDTHFKEAAPGERFGSGLSDFIIDDNDGESLDSDSDDKEMPEDIRQKSTHSV